MKLVLRIVRKFDVIDDQAFEDILAGLLVYPGDLVRLTPYLTI